jgi:hypothetical protein
MIWILVSASWCSACLITKKNLKTLQTTHPFELRVVDVDFEADQLEGREVGQRLPVLYRLEGEVWTRIAQGEQSVKELTRLYEEIA